MTSPGAHGEGEAVTLWRNDWKHSPMPWVGVKWETCDRPAGSTEYRALPVDAYNALLARANTAKVLLKEARDGLKLDADERKQQLASLSVARPGMFDALVYNDAEIKRNTALVSRIDAALGEG